MKKCYKCQQTKPLTDFCKDKSRNDGYNTRCKKCHYTYNRLPSIKRNQQFIIDYLKEHPCVDCGEPNIIVLEFDHIEDNKDEEIGQAIFSAWSIKRIKSEIDKCEVVCANCHRIRTANRVDSYRAL